MNYQRRGFRTRIAAWGARPRLSLLRWDTPNIVLVFGLLVATAWVVGTLSAIGAATGSDLSLGGASRLANAALALVFLIVAASMTWFAILFLNRPVVDRDSYEAAGEERRERRRHKKASVTSNAGHRP